MKPQTFLSFDQCGAFAPEQPSAGIILPEGNDKFDKFRLEMSRIGRFPMQRAALLLLCLFAFLLGTAPARAQESGDDPALTAEIAGLDAHVFDAYNRCDLKAFSSYFSPRVEFYHDKGGVTWDRATVLSNTRKYICGKVRRELLAETLRIYPIKGFGAVEEGEHRFCEISTGACEGIAKFLMIWRKERGNWVMTRVISYGHRPMPKPGD